MNHALSALDSCIDQTALVVDDAGEEALSDDDFQFVKPGSSEEDRHSSIEDGEIIEKSHSLLEVRPSIKGNYCL